jgi:hypothetical protein
MVDKTSAIRVCHASPFTPRIMPTQEDLDALVAAAPLLAMRYQRAPRNINEAIARAHKVLKQHFKEQNGDDFNALQVCVHIRVLRPPHPLSQKWMLFSITFLTLLTTDYSADNYIPELPAVIDDFINNGIGAGPNAAAGLLKFDFRPGASFTVGWNQLCIELVVNHVTATLNLVPAILRPILPNNIRVYLTAAVQTKMKSYFKFYKQSRPRRLPTGVDETPAEVSARVTLARSNANNRNKQQGRVASVSKKPSVYGTTFQAQIQLLSSRMDTIERMLFLYAGSADTLAIWQALYTCLDTMGMEGTSDDEEEADGTRSYRVRVLPWRNPDIAEWMDFIDARYGLIRKKTGNTRRSRRRGGPVSAREPALLLPPWFYNPAYAPLATLTNNDDPFSIARAGLTSVDGLTAAQIQAMRAQAGVNI